MEWLTQGIQAVSLGLQMMGAVEYARDNRPNVSLLAHLRHQQVIKRKARLNRMPNKLLGHNVRIDLKDKPKSVVVKNLDDDIEYRYVIAEPAQWGAGNTMVYKARAYCNKTFSECISVTQTHKEEIHFPGNRVAYAKTKYRRSR